MIKDYISFDLETTGFEADSDYIIEIGALKVRNGKVCERFIEFLKPEMRIPSRITEITGITNDMVQNSRDSQNVIHDFINFCEDYILVGHNILFDYKFIKTYAVQYGYSFEKKGIDTLHIARKMHRNLKSKSLESLCAYYGITNQAAHRAYHDALATAKVYHMLAHDFEQDNPQLFEPEALQFKPKKVQACTSKQIEYLRMLCNHHNLPMKENAEEMTRSDMSKLIDGIISTHGMMRLE